MDWAQITLWALTVFLTIFVIVAIILVVLLIKLSRQIKTVSSSMGQAAVSFDNSVNKTKRMIGVVGFLKTRVSSTKKNDKDGEGVERE